MREKLSLMLKLVLFASRDRRCQGAARQPTLSFSFSFVLLLRMFNNLSRMTNRLKTFLKFVFLSNDEVFICFFSSRESHHEIFLLCLNPIKQRRSVRRSSQLYSLMPIARETIELDDFLSKNLVSR